MPASKHVTREHFYRDKNYVLRDGEPDEEARAARQRQNIDLVRSAGGTKGKLLADRLEACRPGKRCLSAACVHCAHAYQRESTGLIKATWEGCDLVTGTLILEKQSRPIGNLASLNLDSVKRTYRRALEAITSERVPIFGYIDVSLNCRSYSDPRPAYSLHSHFATPAIYRERFNSIALQSSAVRVPLQFKDVADSDWQISYVTKYTPTRRVDQGPGRDPDKPWLKKPENIEFLLWAGDYHPADRTLLIGLRRSKQRFTLI